MSSYEYKTLLFTIITCNECEDNKLPELRAKFILTSLLLGPLCFTWLVSSAILYYEKSVRDYFIISSKGRGLLKIGTSIVIRTTHWNFRNHKASIS